MNRLVLFIREHLTGSLVTLGVILVFFVLVTNFIGKGGKMAVPLKVFPGDAKISVNGRGVRGNPLYLSPGEYTIKASREGFADYEYTYTVPENIKAAQPLYFLLQPESDAAIEWARRNQESYIKLEGEVGETAQEEGEAFYNENTIARLLPYHDMRYRIDYGDSEAHPGKIALHITALSPESKAMAIEKLREWGYEPTDLEIKFLNYANPFVAADEENEHE